jgi:hypothetical protein
MTHEDLLSVHLRVPVTALASCRDSNGLPVTLVGEGHFLTALRDNSRPTDRVKVFQGAAVHIIRPLADTNNASLLVIGGKSVARLDLSPMTGELAVVVKERVLGDWIWDCAQDGAQSRLLFLTAHNRVIVTDLGFNVGKIFAAEEKCILYSGLLRNSARFGIFKSGLPIRIRIGSGFNRVSGSGSVFGIRIREGQK